jgi:hypothetical protein
MHTSAPAHLGGKDLHVPPTPTTARRTPVFVGLAWTRAEMHTAATIRAPAGGRATPVPHMSTGARRRTRVCTVRAPTVASSAPRAAVIPAGRALHVPRTSTSARQTPARTARRALTE